MAELSDTPKEQAKREDVRKPGPGHVDIWANDALVGFSPWDFAIVFGTIQEADSSRLVINEAATVHMSPQFFKRIFNVMQKGMLDYEKAFGKIVDPAGIGG